MATIICAIPQIKIALLEKNLIVSKRFWYDSLFLDAKSMAAISTTKRSSQIPMVPIICVLPQIKKSLFLKDSDGVKAFLV